MSFIDPLYPLFLATGFTVGFGHCIGMCGPIVVSLSLNYKGERLLLAQLLYNLGRVVTYALLGALMGMSGSFTRVAQGLENIQKGILILAGLLIVAMGIGMGGWLGRYHLFEKGYPLQGFISQRFKRFSGRASNAGYFPLGMLLGLLPCGPVYTALIAAARAGMEAENAWAGGMHGLGLMLAFGLGTIPALILVGKLSDLGWLKRRALVYRIASILMIAVGIYFVVKGVRY